ncbi:hypothetical protein GF319_02240 [Candidatus Bathyarchaeota archaeon]|nr:hypothetical protein [Candidatus Bathyarchaeota archaeon]
MSSFSFLVRTAESLMVSTGLFTAIGADQSDPRISLSKPTVSTRNRRFLLVKVVVSCRKRSR